MKVIVLQDPLSKALSIASRVVSTKPNLPILGNIFLEAGQGKLTIAATDLDVGVRLSIKAEVGEEGVIAVPARLFVDFVSSISAGKVDLSTDGMMLKAQSGNYKSSFNCLEGSEFPQFPNKGEGDIITFSKKEFKKGLGKVLFSASTDVSRQILTGILFEFKQKGVSLISTDGFRLSSHNLEGGKKAKENFVIPARGLQELLRSEDLGEGEKEKEIKLSLTENKNQLIIEDGVVQIVLRLLEGKFPDYKKIVPSKFVATISIDREELLKAVKVAAIFARDNANIIHLAVDHGEGTISLSAQAREMGEGSSKLKAEIEGESLEISFNTRFLSEIISVLSTPQVTLELSGALKPMKITEGEVKDFYHVLMPVRTGS